MTQEEIVAALKEQVRLARLGLERAIDALLNGEELHDDGCPMDGTCECELAQALNAAHRATDPKT